MAEKARRVTDAQVTRAVAEIGHFLRRTAGLGSVAERALAASIRTYPTIELIVALSTY